MGWQEVFGLNKAIQNRSIIKDHLIFKDQQYQKHKVEYKKIVFYRCDLIKAVYSYSLPQQFSMSLKKKRDGKNKLKENTRSEEPACTVWATPGLTATGPDRGGLFFPY